MTTRRLSLGDMLLVRLPQQSPPGNEQFGERPAVVVGLPELLGPVRFPMAVIAPLTTDRGQPWAAANPALYPRLPAGVGGLGSDSLVLLDQVRSLGVRRIVRQIGTVPAQALGPIQNGLLRIFSGG